MAMQFILYIGSVLCFFMEGIGLKRYLIKIRIMKILDMILLMEEYSIVKNYVRSILL